MADVASQRLISTTNWSSAFSLTTWCCVGLPFAYILTRCGKCLTILHDFVRANRRAGGRLGGRASAAGLSGEKWNRGSHRHARGPRQRLCRKRAISQRQRQRAQQASAISGLFVFVIFCNAAWLIFWNSSVICCNIFWIICWELREPGCLGSYAWSLRYWVRTNRGELS